MEMKAYLSTMMADNETIWSEILPQYNLRFRPSQMTIYHQRIDMPGGYADARMGPFYLPANETIYIDPSFFNEMKEKFGATGDFAEAYVVAHEYGHHIQNIMGRLKELHSSHGKVSQKASSHTTPTKHSKNSSKRATSKKQCAALKPSGTTGSNNNHKAVSSVTHSHTAPQNNAPIGSIKDTPQVTSAKAKPSTASPTSNFKLIETTAAIGKSILTNLQSRCA
jgi:hypothetical protein